MNGLTNRSQTVNTNCARAGVKSHPLSHAGTPTLQLIIEPRKENCGHSVVTVLHVEYVERRTNYSFLFIFSLFCEYIDLEYVRIRAIFQSSTGGIQYSYSCGCASGIREYVFNIWDSHPGTEGNHEQKTNWTETAVALESNRTLFCTQVHQHANSCRDGGNNFTPNRYRLELNSAHSEDSRDPHTGWSFISALNSSLHTKNIKTYLGYSTVGPHPFTRRYPKESLKKNETAAVRGQPDSSSLRYSSSGLYLLAADLSFRRLLKQRSTPHTSRAWYTYVCMYVCLHARFVFYAIVLRTQPTQLFFQVCICVISPGAVLALMFVDGLILRRCDRTLLL